MVAMAVTEVTLDQESATDRNEFFEQHALSLCVAQARTSSRLGSNGRHAALTGDLFLRCFARAICVSCWHQAASVSKPSLSVTCCVDTGNAASLLPKDIQA
jgi:hypothetical protein